jgi:hypothetical protein
MFIQYGFRLTINVSHPTPVLTRLDVHPSRRIDIVSESPFHVSGVEAPPADVHNLHLIPAG